MFDSLESEVLGSRRSGSEPHGRMPAGCMPAAVGRGWLRAYDVQRRGLCIRASHQYCTEAMSKVGCNSSPILLGKLLDIIKLLCIECKFSDLGTIVILGRLEPIVPCTPEQQPPAAQL